MWKMEVVSFMHIQNIFISFIYLLFMWQNDEDVILI